jgi:ubiquinone/menaquinone biosynthesis C-methylase UbiE
MQGAERISNRPRKEYAMSIAQAEANSDFVNFWNDILVPKFIRWRHILVGGLGLHSAQVFPLLQVKSGDRVLDAGCGFGDTAIELAHRVGPTGAVVGIDCCSAFLEYGRKDAVAAGVPNVEFIEADAQRYPFEPVYDFCFSRFGTQFFENPVAGLRNMRKALKPGGIMTMIVWRSLEDNVGMYLPKQVVQRFLPPPGEKAQTCGPGPFSMADTGVVTQQLRIAGYVEPEFRQIDADIMLGKDLDDAVDFQLAIGPAGEIFREAGELAERRRPEIVAALEEELKPYVTPNGVMMGSSSWMVTAVNPR